MKNVHHGPKPSQFFANVLDNQQIGRRFYRLSLELDNTGTLAFAGVIPGQFIEISVSQIALGPRGSISDELYDKAMREVILRRPFSFCDVRSNGGSVEADILYCVIGPGTVRMTTLCKGDSVSILGPLGNGFGVPENKKYALLVAGGMGGPPLQHLAGFLKQNHSDMEVVAFAGAQSREEIPFTVNGLELEEFSRQGVVSYIATDDGSIGYTGFVTDVVADWLGEKKIPGGDAIIYSCGPEGMLNAVSRLAEKEGIDCQVSMERMMACGIGLCQSCAVRTRDSGGAEGHYKLCCKDGPVFDSKEVIFE